MDLIPAIGMPIPDALRMLHGEWGADRLEGGATLGATTEELRAAGCTPVEMLAVAPREELRRLDTREQTWVLVAPTLMEAGYTPAEAVAHLAAHAPTPETFAAGVSTIVEDPLLAITLAAPRASVDDITALTERFELSPAETAALLANAGLPPDRAIDVLDRRCDGAAEVVSALAVTHLAVAVEDCTVAYERVPVVPSHPGSDVDREDNGLGVGVDL